MSSPTLQWWSFYYYQANKSHIIKYTIPGTKDLKILSKTKDVTLH